MQNQNTHARARAHKHEVFQPCEKSDQIRWRADKHIKVRIVCVFIVLLSDCVCWLKRKSCRQRQTCVCPLETYTPHNTTLIFFLLLFYLSIKRTCWQKPTLEQRDPQRPQRQQSFNSDKNINHLWINSRRGFALQTLSTWLWFRGSNLVCGTDWAGVGVNNLRKHDRFRVIDWVPGSSSSQPN